LCLTHTAPTEIDTLSLHDALPISLLKEKEESFQQELEQLQEKEKLQNQELQQLQETIGQYKEKEQQLNQEISRLQTIPIEKEKSDRKSTRLNSSHVKISYAVFCLK